MTESELMLNMLAEQRNIALDQLVAARAKAIVLQERVKELEAEVVILKSAEKPKE